MQSGDCLLPQKVFSLDELPLLPLLVGGQELQQDCICTRPAGRSWTPEQDRMKDMNNEQDITKVDMKEEEDVVLLEQIATSEEEHVVWLALIDFILFVSRMTLLQEVITLR